MPNRKIVILSVSAGFGHMRAATAMKSALRSSDPGIEVTILDTFKYTSPLWEKVVNNFYMEIIKVSPSLYGYIYSRSEKGQPLSGYAKKEFNLLLSKFAAAKLSEFINDYEPDAVICTHPFPLGVLSTVCKKRGSKYLTVGTITDYTVHPCWVFPETDLYLVGHEKLIDDLVGYGIPVKKIYATGIPIDPAFLSSDNGGLFAELNMDPNLPTILVMGGGLGLGPLTEAVLELGSLEKQCQLLVVAGNNALLKEKIDLMASSFQNRVCALGYVNNVHQLMSISDIMVSKAGGLSCAEALASGLPLFIVNPLPGQEERNSHFLISSGAAIAVNKVKGLADNILSCLCNPSRLKEMSDAASRMGRPGAAGMAADLILSRLNH